MFQLYVGIFQPVLQHVSATLQRWKLTYMSQSRIPDGDKNLLMVQSTIPDGLKEMFKLTYGSKHNSRRSKKIMAQSTIPDSLKRNVCQLQY